MFLVDEVQKLDRNARWNYTFQVLNLETRKIVENFTLKAARQPEHRNLNRYRDVLPYDHSRIELQNGNLDYINGNLVQIEETGRKYILTQGPLPDTCGHFWQMVWEQNSTAVIMLNKVIEKNAVKCHPYWPMGEDEVLEYGDYSVKNLSERSESAYVVRDLLLEHTPSGKNRSIKQFHYMLWPDFGVPSNPESFLEFLYDIRDSEVFDPDQGPPVIHCSAGIGRSGTFCLVDSALLKAELDGKPDNIDVKKLLLQLRKYRVGLVQTPEQLRFSYFAIIQGIAAMYPETFKVEKSDKAEEPHKRKAEDEEPPPIPPRKRVPPEKPPRRVENIETTAAEESLKQRKMVENLRDGIVDESSDEDSGDEEVLDLSASEEDDNGRQVIEPYASEDENDDNSGVANSDFPVNKPLPPLPPSLSKNAVEPEVTSNSEAQSKEEDESETHERRLLPTLSAEDEEDETKPVLENEQDSMVNTNDRVAESNEKNNQKGNQEGTNRGQNEELVKNSLHATADSESLTLAEQTPQNDAENEAEDKARQERELRQRRRRDEKNKQTVETIEKIKRKLKEKELAAARSVLYKKSLIAMGISVGLLIGYYWLVG